MTIKSTLPGDVPLRSDEALWAAFVGGDDGALRELAGRYAHELYWYLLLSTGKPRKAGECTEGAFRQIAAYRKEFEGFSCFRAWLYAVATQSAVPATRRDEFGFQDLIDDLSRLRSDTVRSRNFFGIVDLPRGMRQPFVLVTVVGLPVEDAACVCRMTRERTMKCIAKAYRVLSRNRSFGVGASSG